MAGPCPEASDPCVVLEPPTACDATSVFGCECTAVRVQADGTSCTCDDRYDDCAGEFTSVCEAGVCVPPPAELAGGPCSVSGAGFVTGSSLPLLLAVALWGCRRRVAR